MTPGFAWRASVRVVLEGSAANAAPPSAPTRRQTLSQIGSICVKSFIRFHGSVKCERNLEPVLTWQTHQTLMSAGTFASCAAAVVDAFVDRACVDLANTSNPHECWHICQLCGCSSWCICGSGMMLACAPYSTVQLLG